MTKQTTVSGHMLLNLYSLVIRPNYLLVDFIPALPNPHYVGLWGIST